MTIIDRIRRLAEIANNPDVPLADRSLAAQAIEAERSSLMAKFDPANDPDIGGLTSGSAPAILEKLAAFEKRGAEKSGDLSETAARYAAIPDDVLAQFPDMNMDNAERIAARDRAADRSDGRALRRPSAPRPRPCNAAAPRATRSDFMSSCRGVPGEP